MRNRWSAAVATAVVLLTLVGCGNSSSASTSGTGTSGTGTAASGRTYTIGVLSDVTGPAASVNGSTSSGVQAGIKLAARDGYTIKEVVADTGTSPTQALTAAQKLVEQDNVLAVVAGSAVTFAAAPWLTSHGVPVLGWSEDGPEWLTSRNMFSPGGPSDPAKAATTLGKFLKMVDVTNLAVAGYGYVLSTEGALSFADSARAGGVKVGYLNGSVPLGTTNVQPLALAMKSAGVNGFVGLLEPNAALLTIQSLRQEGVALKAGVLFTGYGGDLQQAGPGAEAAANGVYFPMQFEPVELHTAATEQLQEDLRSVGVTTDPTFAEYMGYLSVDLLVHGLEKAGANATQANLIAALNGIGNYDAAGLLATHSLNVGARTPVPAGVDNCLWFTKLVGTTFQLVPGAEPVCGTLIPGIDHSNS
jgi:ABC-type branched-subunit amino acid transport system substrate-binding protein